MSRYFPKPEECGRHTIFGNVSTRTYAGDHVQLSFVDIPPHGVVEQHSHPNEQIGLVISGPLEFTIGGETKVLGAGDMFYIPGGVPHGVRALDKPVKALDVFYPIRDEYR
jgi:quercetin dioxygenase-like cupin family protein